MVGNGLDVGAVRARACKEGEEAGVSVLPCEGVLYHDNPIHLMFTPADLVEGGVRYIPRDVVKVPRTGMRPHDGCAGKCPGHEHGPIAVHTVLGKLFYQIHVIGQSGFRRDSSLGSIPGRVG
jgi:hypothetical protein